MRSYYLRCPVCGSLDHETVVSSVYVLGTASAKGSHENAPLQTIVICRECGMVFRNPYIPEVCPVHYIWESVDAVKRWVSPAFERRAELVAEELTHKAPLRTGEAFLDIGTGHALVPALLVERFPSARPFLLEPSVNALIYAKMRMPHAVTLPSSLEEADLPKNAFSLITALGVDYLFVDHRRAIESISELLTDGGVFYVERFFLDQPAYYRQPILDMEDLFGLNGMMNTWFGHEQFVEYLGEFFDVFHEITYTYDVTPPPLPRPTVFTGVFCRKRATPGRAKRPPTNYYSKHLELLRKRAPESSLEDLGALAQAGVRNAMICGTGPEARALAALIKENRLFSIAGFLGSDQGSVGRLDAEFREPNPSPEVNAFLVASLERQDEYLKLLEAKGLAHFAFRCFRNGRSPFWSEGSTNVQLKAFLPTTLRQLAGASQFTR